jgi:hypothetical protein
MLKGSYDAPPGETYIGLRIAIQQASDFGR